MCGIFGLVGASPNGELCGAWVQSCMRLLEKRGPDAKGVVRTNRTVLGSRRLRVHDVSEASDQPFESADNRFCLIFNGAIFNYRELREDLRLLGCHFRTTSDTEVLLHAIEYWWIDAPKKLKGMFAFAALDRKKKRLLIGRDAFGIKPLYLYRNPETLVFASEIKPLLAYPGVRRKVAIERLPEQFAFQNLAPPSTIFRDINVLEPGRVLEVDVENISNTQETVWWQIDESIFDARCESDLKSMMKESIAQCWDNDRKTCVHLSGGVDSSLIVALGDELDGKSPPDTHSVIFDDEKNIYSSSRSEEEYIRIVNAKYRCRSHLTSFDDELISGALLQTIWKNEQPLYSANAVLYYLHAKEMYKHCTVVLSGEGADDIFLGYFDGQEITSKLPTLFPQYLSSEQLRALFGGRAKERAYEARSTIVNSERLRGFTPPQKASALTIEVILHGLLARQDRMFMSQSIEGRPAYCSLDLVKLRFQTPDHEIHAEKIGKRNIRALAAQYFGNQFVSRKKRWLSGPVSDWCCSTKVWRNYVDSLDLDMFAQYMNPDPIRRVLALEDSPEKWSGPNLALIFSALNFGVWHRLFIEQQDTPE